MQQDTGASTFILLYRAPEVWLRPGHNGGHKEGNKAKDREPRTGQCFVVFDKEDLP